MRDTPDYIDMERAIRDACVALRAEFTAAVRELRDELGSERVARQDAIASLSQVLDSRTEHLV